MDRRHARLYRLRTGSPPWAAPAHRVGTVALLPQMIAQNVGGAPSRASSAATIASCSRAALFRLSSSRLEQRRFWMRRLSGRGLRQLRITRGVVDPIVNDRLRWYTPGGRAVHGTPASET
jgi:hypothetical protein